MHRQVKNLASQAVRYRHVRDNPSRLFSVSAGEMELFNVEPEDLINITNVSGGAPIWISSLSDDEPTCSGDALALDSSTLNQIPFHQFDARRLRSILNARNGDFGVATGFKVFDAITAPGEVFTFKIAKKCQLIVVSPLQNDFLIAGGGSQFDIEHKPTRTIDSAQFLPDPLGKIRDEWRIPRCTARAYEIKKGQFIQILDVDGRQCSDFMAMRTDALDSGLERYIDSTVSRSLAHGAYPMPGLHDKFYDQDINPLLSVRQDTVGRHDTFAYACTARGYEERGFPGHINCSDNISRVFDPYGIKSRAAWPAINLFFNSWIDPTTQTLGSDEAWSRPGDYVVMEALTDLVCVSTACPDDVDPINGWNPTDIHVRIYEEATSIQHAISFRNQPEDAGRLTRNSAFHSRTSKLTKSYAPAQDLWMPTQYDSTRAVAEYWACKKSATLQDMSPLRKFDIMGPDAEALLQHCMTRDVSKLSEHRGMYALMCDERGYVIDDGTLFRLEAGIFRWCCGSENSALHLREEAERLGLRVWVKTLTGQMANLALQGPKSRDILSDIIYIQPSRPALENVRWFGFTHARLFDRHGPMFMLTRSGFTGELGYEIFCDAGDAEQVWDTIIEAGKQYGLTPMGSDALGMLRIEAGLMVSGAEFAHDVDAMEAGLEFAVDFKKPDFIGRAALERNRTSIRRKLVGLKFNSNEAPTHGDPIFDGRNQIGTVTSATQSPELGHAIAMARIAVENTDDGTQLEVGRLDGNMKRLPCTVTSIPFIDPKREKPRA